jgi:hypothetical protein
MMPNTLDKHGSGVAISEIGMKGMLDELMKKFISPLSTGNNKLIYLYISREIQFGFPPHYVSIANFFSLQKNTILFWLDFKFL